MVRINEGQKRNFGLIFTVLRIAFVLVSFVFVGKVIAANSEPIMMGNGQVVTALPLDLTLTSFKPTKSLNIFHKVSFRIELKNNGASSTIPTGRINISNRSGQQVGTILINSGKKPVEAGKSLILEESWQDERLLSLGTFRAALEVNYSALNSSIYDACRFKVIPAWVVVGLIIIFTGILIIILRPRQGKLVLRNNMKS